MVKRKNMINKSKTPLDGFTPTKEMIQATSLGHETPGVFKPLDGVTLVPMSQQQIQQISDSELEAIAQTPAINDLTEFGNFTVPVTSIDASKFEQIQDISEYPELPTVGEVTPIVDSTEAVVPSQTKKAKA